MSEKVGEMARESADYRCECCHAITRIAKTANLPLSDPTLAWTAPRIEGP